MPLTITWTAPTSRQNGRPLKPDDIARYELQARVNGAPDFSTIADPPSTATTAVLDSPAPGDYEFRIRAIEKNGAPGAWGVAAIEVPDTSPISAPSITLSLE